MQPKPTLASPLESEDIFDDMADTLSVAEVERELRRRSVDRWHWRGHELVDKGKIRARVFEVPVKPWRAVVMDESGEEQLLPSDFASEDDAMEAIKYTVLNSDLGAKVITLDPHELGWRHPKPLDGEPSRGWVKEVRQGKRLGVYPVEPRGWSTVVCELGKARISYMQGRTPRTFASVVEAMLWAEYMNNQEEH